jgi:hypothetical protein
VDEFRWLYLRSVALALLFAGLVAGLGWFADQIDVQPGFVPIWSEEGRSFWLVGMILVALTGVCYRLVDSPPPGIEPRRAVRAEPSHSAGEIATNWVLPSLVVLSSVLVLGVYRGTTAIAAAALISFIGLTFGPVTRQLMIFAGPDGRERARVLFTLLVHGVAFLSLAMIYIHKVRSIFSATAVLIVGVLLLIALTEGEDGLFIRRFVYALVGGIMLGQVTWSLNYWQATGWIGGAVLLVCFYLFGGLIMTHLRRGVDARDVIEYGSVSVIAFGIVVYSLYM